MSKTHFHSFRIIQTAFLFLTTILILVSCEKKVDWDLQDGNMGLIVVDCIITDEWKVQSLRLTQTMKEPNADPVTVSGAEVIVTVGGGIYYFHEDSLQPGYYRSDIQFKGTIGAEHSLLITAQDKIYTAKSGMVPVNGVLNQMQYTYQSDTGLYRVSWATSLYDPVDRAMYELIVDWSMVPGYQASDSLPNYARLLYYTHPTIYAGELFAPSAETIYFPWGSVMQTKKYSLTAEHASYLRALLGETSWQGGFFSSAPSNVPTNLSEGAIGYFGACSVIARTDFVY
jgi:hypothetical protein